MTQTAVFDGATRLIDRFQPDNHRAAHEVLPMRVLIGGALLGLVLSAVSAAASALGGLWPNVVLIGAFSASLAVLLTAIRAGAPLRLLSGFAILLLSAFFVSAALLTRELRWTQVKWLSLLPLVAVLLAEGRPRAGTFARPVGRLWRSTVLSVVLLLLIVTCNRVGLTAGLELPAPGFATDLESVVDSALFTFSISGLMWIQHVAMRKAEEELELLRSMLSVCAWCGRIRDGDEGWVGLERYMNKHTTTRLTHGICPECEKQALAGIEPHTDRRR